MAEINRLRRELSILETRERRRTDELQHRVRNMLAMIRSVVRQSWEYGENQEAYAQHLQGRLDAITRYQTQLSQGRTPGIDLEETLRDELLPTGCLDTSRCTLDGPPVRLFERQAELIGLVVHELATNAIKFGAFAQSGSLIVRWTVDEHKLRLHWTESGVAVAAPAPRRTGFGRRLVEEGLPYELDATASFELRPGGLICAIVIPLGAAAAPGHLETSMDEDPLPSDAAEPSQ